MTREGLFTGTALREGDPTLLQRRLGSFALVMAVTNALGTTIQLLLGGQPGVSASVVLLGTLLTLWLGIWAALRYGPVLPRNGVRALEVGLVCLTSGLAGFVPHALTTELIVTRETGALPATVAWLMTVPAFAVLSGTSISAIVALTQMFALRAALVPTRALHTLGLHVVGGGAFLALAFLGMPWWAPNQAILRDIVLDARLTILVSNAVWFSLTTVVCVAISHIVYGLEREARRARRLGQYQLEAKLGEGGMGIVFRAQHALLRRPTAVKLLPPDRLGERSLARFEREVRLTASLTHPNTVTVFDYGRTPNGLFYYAMELLDGATLQEVVELDGAQSPARVVHVLRGVAGALSEAHTLGLVHRDLKPSNVMLCRQGGVEDVPKLLDFGLVKDVTGSQPGLTQDHSLAGTPLYLAPEVIRSAEEATGCSDLYALGAVAYHFLTGGPVFEGRTVVEVCSHHLHSPVERPSARLGRAVPEMLEELLLDCLAKDPADRPATADEVLARLDALEDVEAWSRTAGEAWWDEHRQAIDRRRSSEVDAEGSTLAIHFDVRRAAARASLRPSGSET